MTLPSAWQAFGNDHQAWPRQAAYAAGDVAAESVGASLPPDFEGRPHHRRPAGRARCIEATPLRDRAVPGDVGISNSGSSSARNGDTIYRRER